MLQGRQRHWIELAIWLIIGAAAYALTYEFDSPIQGYRFGATAWPRAIILGLIAVAVLQFAVAMRAARPAPGPVAPDARAFRLRGMDVGATAKVALAFALPVFYILLLPRTGFYLTTPLFLAAYVTLLGERRWPRVALVTAFIYAIMIVVFTSIFYVPLPVGNWPVFYDINNWLLQAYR